MYIYIIALYIYIPKFTTEDYMSVKILLYRIIYKKKHRK